MKFLLLFLFTFFFLLFPSTIFAVNNLSDVNQKVCNRFEEDVSKLAAIMEELRSREGITETRVAFGGSDTPIKSADYWINFAAEAIAYQRIQKNSSTNELKYSLGVLKNKILRAKNEVKKAIEANE